MDVSSAFAIYLIIYIFPCSLTIKTYGDQLMKLNYQLYTYIINSFHFPFLYVCMYVCFLFFFIGTTKESTQIKPAFLSP